MSQLFLNIPETLYNLATGNLGPRISDEKRATHAFGKGREIFVVNMNCYSQKQTKHTPLTNNKRTSIPMFQIPTSTP